MSRIIAFFVSGLVSFFIVGTVVAEKLAATSLESKPAIAVRTEKPKVYQMSGTIKGVDLVGQTIQVKNRRGEKSFSITPETQFKKGRTRLNMKLGELAPGSKIIVKYWDRDGERQASIIKLQ